MAKKELEEIMEALKKLEPEENKEEFVSLLEDISDSWKDSSVEKELEKKYSELQEKYLKRFYGKKPDHEEKDIDTDSDEDNKDVEDDEDKLVPDEFEIEKIFEEELLNGK